MISYTMDHKVKLGLSQNEILIVEMMHLHKRNYSDLINLNLYTVHHQCNFISLIMNGKTTNTSCSPEVTDDSFYDLQIAKHFEFFSNRTPSRQIETTGKRTRALDNPMQKMFHVRHKDSDQNKKEAFCAEKCKSKIYTACSKEIETKT